MRQLGIKLIMCVVAAIGSAQELTLQETQSRFNEEMQKLQSEKISRQNDLKAMYLPALLRFETRTRREGNLEALQAVRNEIQRVEGIEGLTPPPVEAREYLQALGNIVTEKLAEIEKHSVTRKLDIVNSLSDFSERRATLHTQQGALEKALAWRDWGQSLKEDPVVREALEAQQRHDKKQQAASRAAERNKPAVLRLPPLKPVETKAAKFSATPALYRAGVEPDGDEKRISSFTPSAQGAGHSLLQTNLKLIENVEVLSNIDRRGYDYKHKAHTFVARVEFSPLPGKSLDRSLIVFDLYKRGSGTDRGVIRTEGFMAPPLPSGARWVADAGTYSYETTSVDYSFPGYDRDTATADEFYGYIVSIFDKDGKLLLQRSTERMLNEFARTSVPDTFDPVE